MDGGRMIVHRYNAQGDIATANAIAKEVTSGDFDLIYTASTVSLQTVANANRFATPPRKHVFAIVTDPYAVGVGVEPRESRGASALYDGDGKRASGRGDLSAGAARCGLRLSGLGWCGIRRRANSVVATKLGRAVCASMGITLVEATAENPTMVGEATASLLARGVEAIWVSPDLVPAQGLDVIMDKAKTARIPVFTSIPNETTISGSLFDLGADYAAIGHAERRRLWRTCWTAADPATIPVENHYAVAAAGRIGWL